MKKKITPEYMQQIYPVFFSTMCEFHLKNETWGTGHDLVHDLQVSGYAVRIAQEEFPTEFELAAHVWFAAMLHSTDRFVAKEGHAQWLSEAIPGDILRDDHEEILDAVLEHGKPNNEKDSRVCVILKDADKLANINPMVLLRSAQFRPGLPTHDPRHLEMTRAPGSTYRKPRSVLDDIFGCTEWESWLSTNTAKKLGAPYFAYLKKTFSLTKKAHLESGITPEVLHSDSVAAYLAVAYSGKK